MSCNFCVQQIHVINPLCSERVRDWSTDIVFEHFKLFWQLMNKPKSIFSKYMQQWLPPKLMFCIKYYDHDLSLPYNGLEEILDNVPMHYILYHHVLWTFIKIFTDINEKAGMSWIIMVIFITITIKVMQKMMKVK